MFSRIRRTVAKNSGSAAAMGRGQFRGRHAERCGSQLGLVEPGRIIEQGRQTALPHVVANPLDDLLGRKGLAKYLDRPPLAGLADHVAPRAKPLAQGQFAGRTSACRLSMRRISSPGSVMAETSIRDCRAWRPRSRNSPSGIGPHSDHWPAMWKAACRGLRHIGRQPLEQS